MGFWNFNADKKTSEKRNVCKNISFYSQIINGEQVIENNEESGKKETKVISGGCVDQFDVGNTVVTVCAEPRLGAKNGVDGAKLICEALKLILDFYKQVYKTDERFITAITKNNFAAQLSNLWKELVLINNEEKESQKPKVKFFGITVPDCFIPNVDKKAEENEASGQREKQDKEKTVDVEQVLKDYEASVMFAVITDDNYLIASSGQCQCVVYNFYESDVFEGVDNSAYFGDISSVKLTYKKYPKNVYSNVLMMSNRLARLLPNKDAYCNYAKQVEKVYLRIKNSEDAFVFTEDNGAKNNLATACQDYGAFVSLAVNTQFKLSPEKEQEYREARVAKAKEEGNQARLLNIQAALEAAKDRSVYATYDTSIYDGYESIKIFSARRQGRGHVGDGSPCQDYCLTEKVNKGIVLAVSDGIGSCKKSDEGSKFACEAVLKTIRFADKKSDNEEAFVSLLQSVDFRKKVFAEWRQAVISCEKAKKENGVVTLGDVEQYGATLLFTVITDNYYVVGNIGDGQILLYNQAEATKIRKHLPKEGSSTRSIVDSNGFSETFIVEKYRRSDFSSVLLSTDGMYDPLENSEEFYKYAREAENRFIEKGESYQPFCYTDGKSQEYKDVFSSATFDDCTIVLATDTAFEQNGKGLRRRAIEEKYDFTVVESLGDVSVYASRNESGSYTTVVSKSKVNQPKIDGINFFEIKDSYEKDGYCFNVYNYTNAMTINKLYQLGLIGERKEEKPKSSYLSLKVYEDIMECIDILDKCGYALDQQLAHNLMIYSDETGLVIYPEAIVKKENGVAYDNRRIRALFDSLYGKLVCEDDAYPIFNIDFNNVGGSKYLTPDGETVDYVGVVRRLDSKLYLENCGNRSWLDMNDNLIRNGDRIPLAEGELFKIRLGLETRVYSFVEKKNF